MSNENIVNDFNGTLKYLSFSSLISTPGNFNLSYKSAIHAYMSYMLNSKSDGIMLHEFSPRDVENIRNNDIADLNKETWNNKVEIMNQVQLDKFLSNKKFFDLFLSLGEDVKFVYKNKHHDNFWGDCVCDNYVQCTNEGSNHLGYILNGLRDQLLIEIDGNTAQKAFPRIYNYMIQKREDFLSRKAAANNE